MDSQYQYVASMNEAFGNQAGESADFEWLFNEDLIFRTASWRKLENQCRNILDEIKELEDATLSDTEEDMRDAICDIRVFVLGAFHLLGVTQEQYLDSKDQAYKDIPEILVDYEPLSALRISHTILMVSITERSAQKVANALHSLMEQTEWMAMAHRYPLEADMNAVLDAVMTRFIKDQYDLEATIAMHLAKGVPHVYIEGGYPTMILKSAEDQPDAPRGKFLKSASYRKPVFTESHRPL
jgi:hypothetical protein